MNHHETKHLVGKSFEELSLEEMNALQGSNGDIHPYSESVLLSISVTAASVAISKEVSKAVSVLVTYFKKCV